MAVPSITSASTLIGAARVPLTYQATATPAATSWTLVQATTSGLLGEDGGGILGEDGAPVDGEAELALPLDLSFDGSTGLLSGSVRVAGTYQLRLVGINADGSSLPFILTLIIAPTPMQFFHTPSTPKTESFRRVTTAAYLDPDDKDVAGLISLGRLSISELKHNPGNVDLMIPDKGGLVLADDAVAEVKPIIEATAIEFNPKTIPMFLFGRRLADASQSSSTAATFTCTGATPLSSFYIGKQGLTAVSVAIGGTALAAGVDYQIDVDTGFITFMESANLVDGTPVNPVVTYSAPAAKRNQYEAYSRLNRYGQIYLVFEDTKSSVPREMWTCRVNCMPSDGIGGDPKKYSESKFRMALLGKPTITTRIS